MLKILAADDDPAILEFYVSLFTDGGFEVQTAPDGASAMEKCLDFKPDLLVLDVDMPGGGGGRVFNLSRKILQLGLPVIFVTGLPEQVQHTALSEQKVSIFQKPVKGEALLAEARRLTSKPGPRK
ncbi:MAG: response regulator [Elusimicrobiales bacterium]|nr:response regulator [Elusimicrobiales bacterium]